MVIFLFVTFFDCQVSGEAGFSKKQGIRNGRYKNKINISVVPFISISFICWTI